MSAEQRRAVILDAALEVFAERGYHGASIDEIARKAGISKALIYEHFDSKQDLRSELLETQVQELLGRLLESAATSETGEVRLRAGVDAFLRYVEEHRGAFQMLMRGTTDPEVAEFLLRVQRQATAAVATLIAVEPVKRPPQGFKNFQLSVEMIAQMLTGAAQSLAGWWEDHEQVSREELVQIVMDFAWVGLERLRAGERYSG